MAANCSAESDAVYEVECVLATRVVNRRRQYLVKWIGYPSNKSTWEPAKELKHCSDAVKKFQEKVLQHKKQRLKKKKNSKSAPRITRKLITCKSAPKKGCSSKRGASVDSAASVTARSLDEPNTRRDQQSRLKR
ncbi:chromo domain-containing protein LHP1-like protein, partial [Aphelenchoides avenae]